MKKLFYLFIDGLGLGADEKRNPVRYLFRELMGENPLVKRERSCFFPGGVIVPTDPVLGVPGIPQSATGQTSLFTGINAQGLLGHHLTAFPNERLVSLIKEKSLLKILNEGGIGVTSANMYTNEFFSSRGSRRKNMFPVSTLSIQAAGIPFRFPWDYHQKKALFADITNLMLLDRGYPVTTISPEEGGDRIVNILEETPVVFFEYFMTDLLGHKRDGDGLRVRLADLGRFVRRILELTADWKDFILLIVSDHGNAEDLSTGEHTMNMVPTIIFSDDGETCRRGSDISDLTHVYDFVLSSFLDSQEVKN